MADGKLIDLYTDGRRVNDAANPREAAVFSLVSCYDGDFELAARLLPKAAGDTVLGVLAILSYFGCASDDETLKEALSQLVLRYPVRDTTVPKIDEPLRNNYLIGQSGSPLKFEKGEIVPLDALIYKIVAVDAAVRMGVYLKYADSIGGAVAFEELRKKLVSEFYDKKTGLYRAVRTDGGFSPFLNVVSLLPLYAGASKDKRKVWSVLRLYLDKEKFCAKNGITVLPKDSPFYGREFIDYNGAECEKFESFSGGVYPEFSLLAYFGLIRTGADTEASELAVKMENAFETECKNDVLPRFYLPDGRYKSYDGENYCEALLMPIAARYDRCGAELFSARKELRFSTALWKSGDSQAVYFDGERIRFAMEGASLKAYKDGEAVISADVPSKGALYIRKLRKEEEGLSFIADSPADGVKVTFSAKLFGGSGGNVTVILKEGKSVAVVDFGNRTFQTRRFNGRG